MLTFTTILALAAITSVSAGLITPTPFVRAYGAYPSHLITPAAGLAVQSGFGIEGRYIPDHLETLYDDGSYRPEASPIPLAASPYGLVPAGSGLEGQYVQDHFETLYDDGSYKPEPSPLPLSASPYGLVPAGSGLEGQYVPDFTEKLFDDGSYRHEYFIAK